MTIFLELIIPLVCGLLTLCGYYLIYSYSLQTRSRGHRYASYAVIFCDGVILGTYFHLLYLIFLIFAVSIVAMVVVENKPY